MQSVNNHITTTHAALYNIYSRASSASSLGAIFSVCEALHAYSFVLAIPFCDSCLGLAAFWFAIKTLHAQWHHRVSIFNQNADSIT